jgi:hypothetical protein
MHSTNRRGGKTASADGLNMGGAPGPGRSYGMRRLKGLTSGKGIRYSFCQSGAKAIKMVKLTNLIGRKPYFLWCWWCIDPVGCVNRFLIARP